MKKTVLLAGSLFWGMSILIFVEGIRVKKALSATDFRTPLRPDTYLWVLAVAMALVTMCYVLGHGKHAARIENDMSFGPGIRYAALSMVIFIGSIIGMQWLGYCLSTFGFYVLFFLFVGQYSYKKTLLLSIAITIGLEVAFGRLAGMPLPKGIVENALLSFF